MEGLLNESPTNDTSHPTRTHREIKFWPVFSCELLGSAAICIYRMRFNFRGVYISRICNFRVFRVFKFTVAGYSGVEIFADIRSESVCHNSTVKPV